MEKKEKKKKHVTVHNVIINVKATFNNTMIAVTDEGGNVLYFVSAGYLGFKGSKKSAPHAAKMTSNAAALKALNEFGARTAVIKVKGVGPGRDSALRELAITRGHDNQTLTITTLMDVTSVAHSSRPAGAKKERRV